MPCTTMMNVGRFHRSTIDKIAMSSPRDKISLVEESDGSYREPKETDPIDDVFQHQLSVAEIEEAKDILASSQD